MPVPIAFEGLLALHKLTLASNDQKFMKCVEEVVKNMGCAYFWHGSRTGYQHPMDPKQKDVQLATKGCDYDLCVRCEVNPNMAKLHEALATKVRAEFDIVGEINYLRPENVGNLYKFYFDIDHATIKMDVLFVCMHSTFHPNYQCPLMDTAALSKFADRMRAVIPVSEMKYAGLPMVPDAPVIDYSLTNASIVSNLTKHWKPFDYMLMVALRRVLPRHCALVAYVLYEAARLRVVNQVQRCRIVNVGKYVSDILFNMNMFIGSLRCNEPNLYNLFSGIHKKDGTWEPRTSDGSTEHILPLYVLTRTQITMLYEMNLSIVYTVGASDCLRSMVSPEHIHLKYVPADLSWIALALTSIIYKIPRNQISWARFNINLENHMLPACVVYHLLSLRAVHMFNNNNYLTVRSTPGVPTYEKKLSHVEFLNFTSGQIMKQLAVDVIKTVSKSKGCGLTEDDLMLMSTMGKIETTCVLFRQHLDDIMRDIDPVLVENRRLMEWSTTYFDRFLYFDTINAQVSMIASSDQTQSDE